MSFYMLPPTFTTFVDSQLKMDNKRGKARIKLILYRLKRMAFWIFQIPKMLNHYFIQLTLLFFIIMFNTTKLGINNYNVWVRLVQKVFFVDFITIFAVAFGRPGWSPVVAGWVSAFSFLYFWCCLHFDTSDHHRSWVIYHIRFAIQDYKIFKMFSVGITEVIESYYILSWFIFVKHKSY